MDKWTLGLLATVAAVAGVAFYGARKDVAAQQPIPSVDPLAVPSPFKGDDGMVVRSPFKGDDGMVVRSPFKGDDGMVVRSPFGNNDGMIRPATDDGRPAETKNNG